MTCSLATMGLNSLTCDRLRELTKDGSTSLTWVNELDRVTCPTPYRRGWKAYPRLKAAGCFCFSLTEMRSFIAHIIESAYSSNVAKLCEERWRQLINFTLLKKFCFSCRSLTLFTRYILGVPKQMWLSFDR